MENFNNEVFGFGNEIDEEVEKSSPNFDYNNISGLGESNYENEDLFKMDNLETVNNNVRINENGEIELVYPEIDESFENQDIPPVENYIEPESVIQQNINETNNDFVELSSSQNQVDFTNVFDLNNNSDSIDNLQVENYDINEEPILEEAKIDTFDPVVEESIVPIIENENIEETNNQTVIEENQNIELSETPIEDLNKLTEYEEEKIESTDINSIFDRLSVNVKDASEIFKRNTEMKNKIDTRFEELKKLQSEVESTKKKQIDEINDYKEDVLNKLTEKKSEIEKRLNVLKDLQASFEKEKLSFEQYKREEKSKIEQIKKEVQAAYDERREQLNHIEDVLRKQKDALDEERSQLALDKIEYESNKNDLANNLLKFNELVNSFTNGVGDIKE